MGRRNRNKNGQTRNVTVCKYVRCENGFVFVKNSNDELYKVKPKFVIGSVARIAKGASIAVKMHAAEKVTQVRMIVENKDVLILKKRESSKPEYRTLIVATMDDVKRLGLPVGAQYSFKALYEQLACNDIVCTYMAGTKAEDRVTGEIIAMKFKPKSSTVLVIKSLWSNEISEVKVTDIGYLVRNPKFVKEQVEKTLNSLKEEKDVQNQSSK